MQGLWYNGELAKTLGFLLILKSKVAEILCISFEREMQQGTGLRRVELFGNVVFFN